MEAREEIRFYFDYKSPYAYLAFDPVLALEQSHRVTVRPVPTEIDIQAALGGETYERTERDWAKVRYLYLDARRFANDRGLIIRGPQKIFDSRLSLIGGLWAERQGAFAPYSRKVFEGFFTRTLDIENRAALEAAMAEVGCDPAGFADFAEGEGSDLYAEAKAERDRNKVFGVPTVFIGDEPFWGYDRLDWVRRRLDEAGLKRA